MISFSENTISRTSYTVKLEVEKMEKGELTLEDILSNNDIIQDIKSNPNSDFIKFFTNDIIIKLVDYSLKMPKSDDPKIAYQYPFNATEILCSNIFIMPDKFISEGKDIDTNNINDNEENEKNSQNYNTIMNSNEDELQKNNIDKDNNKMDEKKENEESKEDINNNNDDNDNNNCNKNKINDEKEKITKNIMKYNIIDYLFDFLKESNSENNSNYVLVGYYNKILNNLIDNQSEKIINYTYNYPDKDKLNFFSLFINHMSKKAICNILLKILLYENEQIPDLYDKKIIVSQNIVKELQNTDDNIKYENICNTICKALENKKLFQIFMKDENFIKILFELLNDTKNDKNKSNNILNLHIKINEQILKNFERKFTHDIYEENQNDFLKAILGNDIKNIIDEKEEKNYIIDQSIIKDILKIIFNILKDNKFNFLNDLPEICNNHEFISTYEQKQQKLSMKKLLQVEYIRSLLDLLVNSYAMNFQKKEIISIIEILKDLDIFWTLHYLFFAFPFCNILQVYYSQIIDIITNIYTPDSLVKYFLLDNNNKNLTSYIIQHILEKCKFIYNSKRKALNPCLIYEINILNQLMDCNNDEVQSINEHDKDLSVFNEVLSDELNTVLKAKILYKENGSGEVPIGTDDTHKYTPIVEIIDSGKKIYEIYMKGGDYKQALSKRYENVKNEKDNDKSEIENGKKEQIINKEFNELINKPIQILNDNKKIEAK